MIRPEFGTATVVRGNALALPLADDSVDLVVTSPPYFGLRSYQDGGEHYADQVGAEATPSEFVDSLLVATAEMARVVKPTGSIWVNLGDKYAGGGGQWDKDERDREIHGKRTDRRNINTGGKTFGFRHKSLLGIPWRYAIRCVDELGLILRAEVIWSKPNGLPESVTDRVRRCHEQWFHFTLQPRYYSAVDEIRDPYAESTAAQYARGYKVDNRALTGNHHNGPQRSLAAGDGGPTATNPLGKLPGSVWTIATEPLIVPEDLGVDHFAAFPLEWPRRIIAGWSPVGICGKCGEGRRPAAIRDLGRKERDTPAYGAGHHGGDSSTLGSRGSSAVITAYVCACTPYVDHPGESVERTDDRQTGLPQRSTRGQLGTAPTTGAWREYLPEATQAPTTPAVVLDPFGGTGTTALVARSMGRTGITVDKSADYCRLARWRTTDEGELARALQVDKPKKQVDQQTTMFDFLEAD